MPEIKGMTDPCQLFVDGGVIGRNPSVIGGTWAARLVKFGVVVNEWGGVITPEQAQMPEITNNLTEMLALIKGLTFLPWDWRGTVYSDSQITLGRVFMGWKWSGIPWWMHNDFQNQTARLVHWRQIHYTLLSGHPTKAELESGIGKRGTPVSIHNKWCDEECGRQAAKFATSQKELVYD